MTDKDEMCDLTKEVDGRKYSTSVSEEVKKVVDHTCLDHLNVADLDN